MAVFFFFWEGGWGLFVNLVRFLLFLSIIPFIYFAVVTTDRPLFGSSFLLFCVSDLTFRNPCIHHRAYLGNLVRSHTESKF